MWSSHITYNYAQSNQAPPPSYEFWNSEMQAIADSSSKPGLIYFKDDFDTPPEDIFTVHKDAFGLGEDDSMYLFKDKTDEFGINNFWFKRYHKNIEVFNSFNHLILKPNNQKYIHGNINVIPYNTLETNINTTSIQLIYDTLFETKDIFYFVNNEFKYSKYYKYEYNHKIYEKVFSQLNGEILFENLITANGCIHSEELLGCTKQVGNNNVQITLDLENNNYKLINDCNPTTINLNVNYGFGVSCVYVGLNHPYTNEIDNLSCNHENVLNLIWASDKTYKYFINEHEETYLSNDVEDYLEIKYFAEVLNPEASYNSNSIILSKYMNSLDVFAHEFTHGIEILESSINGMGMASVPESRALRESFCDIMSTVVEHSVLQENANWFWGERVQVLPDNSSVNTSPWPYGYRNLKKPVNGENPHIEGYFTYSEIYFPPYIGNQSDHANSLYPNSQPHSYMFYLLCEGGSGVNNDGVHYNINPIGMDKAKKLAYKVFIDYLTNKGTDYHELFEKYQIVAQDLISVGYLTNEDYCTILKAWRAIGIYSDGINSIPPTSYNGISNLQNQTYYFDGDLVVEQGATLNITDAILKFSNGSKILLRNGATLNVNYSTLENNDEAFCEDYWIGVEAEGANNQINISYSYLKNANVGINILDGGNNNQINLLHNEFKNCSKAILIDNQSVAGTIERNIFRNTIFGEQNNNLIGGGSANTSVQFFDVYNYNSNLSNVGPESDISFNSIIYVNYEALNQQKNKNLGIEILNNYSNIQIESNHFYNLNKCIVLENYPYSEIKSNFFSQCNNGIQFTKTFYNNFFNNLVIDGNIFNRVMKNITFINDATNPFNEFEIKNSVFRNIPAPSEDDDSYAIYFKNAFGNIENSRFYGSDVVENDKRSFGIKIEEVFGFIQTPKFEDNYFEGLNTGIETNIYGLNIINNEFKKLKTAVKSTESILVDNCEFNQVQKGVYLIFGGEVKNSEFLNIQSAGNEDAYGVFVVGGGNGVTVQNNTFTGNSSANPTNFASYGAVFEQTGNSQNIFFNNNLQGVDVGIQAQGANNNLGIFCNNFSHNGTAHQVAGIRLTTKTVGSLTYSGSLRSQGVECYDADLPAGNEWHNTTGNKDIVIDENQNGQRPYFKYVAHAQDLDGDTKTQPKHAYGAWWENHPQDSKRLRICDLNDAGGNKQSTSCDESTGKSLPLSNANVVNGVLGLLDVKQTLVSVKDLLAQDLLLAQTQEEEKEIYTKIKETDVQLSTVLDKLFKLYVEDMNTSAAEQLLQDEQALEGKKTLAKYYYENEEYVKSKQTYESLEQILNTRDVNYYNTLDEKEAEEFNALYFKEIYQLLINAKEDNRKENELLEWELYALKMIADKKLPVSVEAEKLLVNNRLKVDEHAIEKRVIVNELYDSTTLENYPFNLLMAPNPAMEWTNISLNIPNTANSANLHIANIYHLNNTLHSIPLTTGENNLQLNVNTWQPSLYAVSVQVDGVIYDTKILVVIN